MGQDDRQRGMMLMGAGAVIDIAGIGLLMLGFGVLQETGGTNPALLGVGALLMVVAAGIMVVGGIQMRSA